MTPHNPYAVGEKLHDDFLAVSEAQLSPARQDAAAALLGRGGCLKDALLVYAGVDPTHEVDNHSLWLLDPEAQMEETMSRAAIGLHAAEVMIGSLAHPGLYDRRDSRRVRILSQQTNWHHVYSEKSRDMTTPFDTIYESLGILEDRNLSLDELKMMSKAAEMLGSALAWWQGAHVQLYKSDTKAYSADKVLQTIYKWFEEPMVAAVIKVQETVKEKTIDDDFVTADTEQTLEKAKLGLKAQWRTASMLLHPVFRIALGENSTIPLKDMVDSLRKVFLDNDLINTNVYPKSEIKGLLHESLWFLDTSMIIAANPDKYQSIAVGVTAQRFDEPIINRPQLSRGIDNGIIDLAKEDADMQQINLKSSPKHPKPYHPRIKVLEEADGDFQDLQKRRLAAKLGLYKKILDHDFKSPDALAILEKYALPTAKRELALHENQSVDEDWYLAKA